MKKELNSVLKDLLEKERNRRGFDPQKYIGLKVRELISFFDINKIDTIVVGISGGIDSALVLHIMDAVKRFPLSPLKNIIPVIAPISNSKGVSDQDDSVKYAVLVCENLGLKPYIKDLKQAYDAIVDQDNPANDNWTEGQMASVLRTPLMYYVAALEQSKGNKSIVVGTTNKSEGSYIGFYGKASDGMNDLQPITDLYKSEVFELSKLIGVPKEILNRTPKGDIHDDLSDEQLMGVTYDELELYLLYKEHHTYGSDELFKTYSSNKKTITNEVSKSDLDFVNTIESLHKKNIHKYSVGLPSHQINVIGKGIKGGWENKITVSNFNSDSY